MKCSFVFLAILALGAATVLPYTQKQKAADQEFLQKQQDIIHLLQHIGQDIQNEKLYQLGVNYNIVENAQNYQNPIIVQYYAGAVQAGLVQPKGTVFANSVTSLRKEVALLTQILLGAQDYTTFLQTAAWARVHVNEYQFVQALSIAVLQHPQTQGIILPPPYEVLPSHYINSQIIHHAQQIGAEGISTVGGQNIVIPVNHTVYMPHEEQKLVHYTHDIGLQAYYYYVQLSGYILDDTYQHGEHQGHHIGHGSHYYYIHQQLLAHYYLERLTAGVGPIPHVDYEHVQIPYNPHLTYLNGLAVPGRPESLYLHPYKNQLVQIVQTLEQRLIDAIDAGHVITPQGAFLNIYQPQGLDILANLIEGTGRSINPRYYGSLQAAFHQLLGNTPIVNNIYEYTPSVLELGHTTVSDPAFYQLYQEVIGLFQKYQNSLPAYQYNDLHLPGVTIQKVDVSKLVTYIDDYFVDLDTVTVQHGQQSQHQNQGHIKAQLQRLDHKPYSYQIVVNSQKAIPNVVVRVYLGPKYDHAGHPISISTHRHYFVELDQFIHTLQEGQNIISRNSQQSPNFSYDYPSVQEIYNRVHAAVQAQEPFYVTEPWQIFGYPARLALPKGTVGGHPLQLLVVITGQGQQNMQYGPVIEPEIQTYQSQHFQVVTPQEYTGQGVSVQGVQQTVDVLPLYENGEMIGMNVHHHAANFYCKPLGINGVFGVYQQPQSYIQQGYFQQGYTGGVHGQVGHGIVGHVPIGQEQVNQESVAHGQYIQGHNVGGVHHVGQQGVVGGIHQQYGQGQQGVYGQQYQGQQYQGQQYKQQQGQYQQGHVGQGYYDQLTQGVQGITHGYHSTYQGTYQGQSQGHEYTGSGPYHQGGFQGIYGYQDQKQQQSYVSQYYEDKPVSHIIGGAISLDGKPLGFPLDRPLAVSALYVPNIYVKDVYVYHEEQPIDQIYV
ncbi:hexamerin-like [Prorops nasuta]|uniref:hexamerin-like n=1 Tax=Prorops nasuta TaxID=863751 RepID=UPI0034CF3B65